MNKTLIAIVVLVVAVFVGSFNMASAQVTSGNMPILYDVSGNPVNTSGGTLATGTYYLDQDGDRPVSYTGGVFYDPSNDSYGGSIYNPTGRAGSFVMPAGATSATEKTGPMMSSGVVTQPSSVGIPNTGLGGDSSTVLGVLYLSAMVAFAGMVYLARAKSIA